jgi:predicted porin
MKKIALSTLVICSALSTVAHAQSSVTIYGQIDTAIVHETGMANGANVTQMVNGGLRASRLGFMGSEDLGGGLSTIFVLEDGFNSNNGAATQAGTIFGRKAYVGFTGGFGTATLGRMYTLSYSAIDFFDTQDGIGGGNDNMFTRGGTRRSNNIRYDSPTFAGFSGSVSYALPQNITSRGTEGLITYTNGPVVIKLVRNDQNGANLTNAAHNTFLGGAYDFGVLKATAGYQVNRGPGSDQPDTKYNVALVGIRVPIGVTSAVGATYIRAKDQTAANNNAQQYAISYEYFLSKRTTLYAAYTHVHNQNGTLLYMTGDAPGTTEYTLGVNHTF